MFKKRCAVKIIADEISCSFSSYKGCRHLAVFDARTHTHTHTFTHTYTHDTKSRSSVVLSRGAAAEHNVNTRSHTRTTLVLSGRSHRNTVAASAQAIECNDVRQTDTDHVENRMCECMCERESEREKERECELMWVCGFSSAPKR